jgi:hypothetical protein
VLIDKEAQKLKSKTAIGVVAASRIHETVLTDIGSRSSSMVVADVLYPPNAAGKGFVTASGFCTKPGRAAKQAYHLIH